MKLDRNAKLPVFKQIFNHLRNLIDRQALMPGFRLPSSRKLAIELGVSRSTVVKVYEELWALGYLNSRPGSYSIIRERKKRVSPEVKNENSHICWQTVSNESANNIYNLYQDIRSTTNPGFSEDVIDMSKLSLDPGLFPTDDFRKCMNRVLKMDFLNLHSYRDSQGYLPLRDYIAKRLQIHNISTSAEEILITNGSQNSFELILKLLTKPGSKVIVEAPTYFLILPLLKYYQINAIDLPIEKDGMDLAKLEKVLNKNRASFLYTMPNFHNPTGITTCQDHRERLLSICEKHHLPIVEDAFEEEMKHCGRVPFPIKSIDQGQIVLYLGSFSKVFSPGLRIGWIAADKKCIKRLQSLKIFSDIMTNLPAQAALAEFCHQGLYELHIKRMQRIIRKRMQFALKSLRKYLKFENVSWTEPCGGYLIWLSIKQNGITEDELKDIFLKNGVLAWPGNKFFISRKSSEIHFRLSISALNENEIEEGIRRIGKVLVHLYEKRSMMTNLHI